jgi:hypothetical protein
MRKFIDILNEIETKDKTKGPITLDINMEPHNAGSVTTTAGRAKKDVQVPGKKASAQQTRVSVKPINDPRAGNFMRDIANMDMQDEISDAEAARNAGHTPTHQGEEPVPPTPENLPAIISTAVAQTGENIQPNWHMVKHLPGYMQNAIRTLGRSVFRAFTDTPIEDIQVLSTLSNSETEVRGMMAWIKHNGIRDDRAELDFDGTINGYGADVQIWNVEKYTFMLVKDFAGYYIYGWPGGRGVHVGNTKMKQIESREYWTVYDHTSDGTSVQVMKKPDGTYYGDSGDFDFVAKDKDELHHKLKKWGYNTNPVGYDKID